jgi:hypothetical protein
MHTRGISNSDDKLAGLRCKDCGDVLYTLKPGESPAARGYTGPMPIETRAVRCQCGEREIKVVVAPVGVQP